MQSWFITEGHFGPHVLLKGPSVTFRKQNGPKVPQWSPLGITLMTRKLCSKTELRGTDMFSVEATLSKLFCLLSEKGSIQKRKNFKKI